MSGSESNRRISMTAMVPIQAVQSNMKVNCIYFIQGIHVMRIGYAILTNALRLWIKRGKLKNGTSLLYKMYPWAIRIIFVTLKFGKRAITSTRLLEHSGKITLDVSCYIVRRIC